METILKDTYLSGTIAELHSIFNKFNTHFFNGKLEIPVIVIQTRTKRTLGTFSVNRPWKIVTEEGNKFEITLSGEYLHRPTEEICATLLHEMVHLYNEVNEIKDTSNNNVYHNKKFKEQAEKFGLIITHAKTIGWSVTELQETTKEVVKGFKINEEAFFFHREGGRSLEYLPKVKFTDLTPKERLQYLLDKRAALENKLNKLQEKIEKQQSEVEA